MQNHNSKFKIAFLIYFILLVGAFTAGYLKLFHDSIKPVFADEDEDENEDSLKIEYKTVYAKLPDTVAYITKKIPRYDSDGDGLYDDEDTHPEINEFFIVKDDNLNGIDDRYEQ